MNSQKQYTTEGIPRKNTLQREHCTTEGIQGTIHYRGNSRKIHYKGNPRKTTPQREHCTTEGISRNNPLQRESKETLHYRGNSRKLHYRGNSQKIYTIEGTLYYKGNPRNNPLQREFKETLHYRGNSRKHYTTEGTPGNTTLYKREFQGNFRKRKFQDRHQCV